MSSVTARLSRAMAAQPTGTGRDGQVGVIARVCDADCVVGGCGEHTALQDGILCAGCDLFLCHPCFGEVVQNECQIGGRWDYDMSLSQPGVEDSRPGSLPCPLYPWECSVHCIAHEEIRRALRHPLNRGPDGDLETIDSEGISPHKMFLLAERRLAESATVVPVEMEPAVDLAPLIRLRADVCDALSRGGVFSCPNCGVSGLNGGDDITLICPCGFQWCSLCGRHQPRCIGTGCAEWGCFLSRMPGWGNFAMEGESPAQGALHELLRRRQAFFARGVMEKTDPMLWTAFRRENPSWLRDCPTLGRHIEWDELASAELPLFGSYFREANDNRKLCQARQRLAFALRSCSPIDDYANLPNDIMGVICDALPLPSVAVAKRAVGSAATTAPTKGGGNNSRCNIM